MPELANNPLNQGTIKGLILLMKELESVKLSLDGAHGKMRNLPTYIPKFKRVGFNSTRLFS